MTWRAAPTLRSAPTGAPSVGIDVPLSGAWPSPPHRRGGAALVMQASASVGGPMRPSAARSMVQAGVGVRGHPRVSPAAMCLRPRRSGRVESVAEQQLWFGNALGDAEQEPGCLEVNRPSRDAQERRQPRSRSVDSRTIIKSCGANLSHCSTNTLDQPSSTQHAAKWLISKGKISSQFRLGLLPSFFDTDDKIHIRLWSRTAIVADIALPVPAPCRLIPHCLLTSLTNGSRCWRVSGAPALRAARRTPTALRTAWKWKFDRVRGPASGPH